MLLRSELDAYGADMTMRYDRYARMEEYMELCYKLWDSWDSHAIVADKASGIFADPAKVHVVDTKVNTSSARDAHLCAVRRNGARYCGRPALPTAGGTSRPGTPKPSSLSTPRWSA